MHKKAGLQSCCSALQGSSIALTSEQTTLKPTPYVREYAYAYHIIHTNGHPCCNVLVVSLNLLDSEEPKQSALDAFFNMSCISPTRKTYSLSVS